MNPMRTVLPIGIAMLVWGCGESTPPPAAQSTSPRASAPAAAPVAAVPPSSAVSASTKTVTLAVTGMT